MDSIEINLHTDEPQTKEDHQPTYPGYESVTIERPKRGPWTVTGPCAPWPEEDEEGLVT